MISIWREEDRTRISSLNQSTRISPKDNLTLFYSPSQHPSTRRIHGRQRLLQTTREISKAFQKSFSSMISLTSGRCSRSSSSSSRLATPAMRSAWQTIDWEVKFLQQSDGPKIQEERLDCCCCRFYEDTLSDRCEAVAVLVLTHPDGDDRPNNSVFHCSLFISELRGAMLVHQKTNLVEN